MMAEPKWDELDQKEKELCSKMNLKPADYLNLKVKVFEEKAKNKAITQSKMNEYGRDIRAIKEKIPNIYEFWVKTNFISK